MEGSSQNKMEQDSGLIFFDIKSAEIDGLKKEFGESQEGEENGADEGGEISTIQGLEEKALTNPVILNNIFSHLEFPVLIRLRLVCKGWDELIRGSPEFCQRYCIDVQRLFPCCTIAPVPKINPTLAKKIFVTNRCRNENECDDGGKQHDPKQTADAAAYNLTTFFNQYHNYVENIEFDGQHYDSFYTYLVKALNVLDFPRLQRIVINDMFDTGSFGYYWNWGNYKDDLIPTFVTYLRRPNLTSLQLHHTIAGSPLHDVFQKLIKCAPNLEEIIIGGNFYPNLSKCKKLKILKYSGIPYKYARNKRLLEEPSFNMESLSTMLDQTKHSLMKLSLKDSYFDCIPSDSQGHAQMEGFKFPDAGKKLQILKIQENSKPFFQPELKKLNPVQFPELDFLSIIVKSLDGVLGEISHSHGFATISSLHLSGTLSPHNRRRIPIIFPNLISLTMPWSAAGWENMPDFDSFINFCSGWKLRELDIETTLQSDWSKFTAGLGRLRQTQSDIRMLKVRSPKDPSSDESKLVFHLWYDSKKQQQQVGSVRVDHILQDLTFGPQSMKIAMEENVLEFILKHPIAVHFIEKISSQIE